MLGGNGPVEADETFVVRKPGKKKNRGCGHKNAVFSLVERNGVLLLPSKALSVSA